MRKIHVVHIISRIFAQSVITALSRHIAEHPILLASEHIRSPCRARETLLLFCVSSLLPMKDGSDDLAPKNGFFAEV
jgi:hypothetical protein